MFFVGYVVKKKKTGLPLIGSVLRVLQYHSEGKDDGTSKEDSLDDQLEALADITAEFFADICIRFSKVIPNENFSNFPIGSDFYLRFLSAAECLLMLFVSLFLGHCGRFGEERLPYGEDFSHSCTQFNQL